MQLTTFVMALTQLWVLCTLTHGKDELRVAIMRNALESGVERKKREKEQK